MQVRGHEDESRLNEDRRANDWILKSFVPETVTLNKADDIEDDHQLCGVQISTFYDSVVVSTDDKPNNGHTLAVEKPESSVTINGPMNCDVAPNESRNVANHEFFRCAESGDVVGLRNHIDRRGLSVDAKDDYGWTALMCAACQGSDEAVAYLLDRGADRKITDRMGTSALLLANKNGHLDVVKRLLLSDDSQSVSIPECSSSPPSSSSSSSRNAGFHCATCRLNFVDQAHVSSTVHQFNERKKRTGGGPPTYYHIPESNVGYRIMLKDGWDREQGLGSTGSGIKFPVKTVLKRNKRGLGAEKLKARITHFGPGDVSAVQRELRSNPHRRAGTVARHERARDNTRQKRLEITLRRQFNELE